MGLPLRDRMVAHLLARTYTSKKMPDKLFPEANWGNWSTDSLAWGYAVIDELMDIQNVGTCNADGSAN